MYGGLISNYTEKDIKGNAGKGEIPLLYFRFRQLVFLSRHRDRVTDKDPVPSLPRFAV